MIDLTPLDVRKKQGDFTKVLRGYEAQQVDSFLGLVAERLEELVKENLMLTERVERLAEQVEAQTGREQAVNDALVTAQELRADISRTAQREADVLRAEAQADCDRLRSEAERETRDLRSEVDNEVSKLRIDAEAEARSIVSDAERRVEELHHVMRELERRRARFLTNFRQLLERELDTVEVQEARNVDEDMPVDLDLGGPSVVASAGMDDSDDESADEPEPSVEDEAVEALDAGEELYAATEDVGAAIIVDDGIRAEPLGVFEPVDDVPPVPSEKPPEEAPWGVDVDDVVAPADVAEHAEETSSDDGIAADAPPAPERPGSTFSIAPNPEREEPAEHPSELDPELEPPAPDADVHNMASDTRLAPEPPDSGLDWLESEESEDDR